LVRATDVVVTVFVTRPQATVYLISLGDVPADTAGAFHDR
jgi:hypothetical protein